MAQSSESSKQRPYPTSEKIVAVLTHRIEEAKTTQRHVPRDDAIEEIVRQGRAKKRVLP